MKNYGEINLTRKKWKFELIFKNVEKTSFAEFLKMEK